VKADSGFESQQSLDVIREDLFPSCWSTLQLHGWRLLHKIEAGRPWWWAENQKTGQHTPKSRPIAAAAAWDILSLKTA